MKRREALLCLNTERSVAISPPASPDAKHTSGSDDYVRKLTAVSTGASASQQHPQRLTATTVNLSYLRKEVCREPEIARAALMSDSHDVG